MTLAYIITGLVLCVVAAADLRWMLRDVFEVEIKKFPLKLQRIVFVAIGIVFSAIMAILLYVNINNCDNVCLGLFVTEMVAFVAYDVILHIAYKRFNQNRTINEIRKLGFTENDDAAAIRRELMKNSDFSYSLPDIITALRVMSTKPVNTYYVVTEYFAFLLEQGFEKTEYHGDGSEIAYIKENLKVLVFYGYRLDEHFDKVFTCGVEIVIGEDRYNLLTCKLFDKDKLIALNKRIKDCSIATQLVVCAQFIENNLDTLVK